LFNFFVPRWLRSMELSVRRWRNANLQTERTTQISYGKPSNQLKLNSFCTASSVLIRSLVSSCLKHCIVFYCIVIVCNSFLTKHVTHNKNIMQNTSKGHIVDVKFSLTKYDILNIQSLIKTYIFMVHGEFFKLATRGRQRLTSKNSHYRGLSHLACSLSKYLVDILFLWDIIFP